MACYFIAKENTWFDAGTCAELIDDYGIGYGYGLFRGLKDGKIDEEACRFDEFDVREETE